MPLRTYGKDARRQNMDVSSFKDDGNRMSSFSRVKATGEGSKGLTQSKRVGVSSACANKFQALRDILENYSDSESCLAFSASPSY